MAAAGPVEAAGFQLFLTLIYPMTGPGFPRAAGGLRDPLAPTSRGPHRNRNAGLTVRAHHLRCPWVGFGHEPSLGRRAAFS